jgi:hypothetical protein
MMIVSTNDMGCDYFWINISVAHLVAKNNTVDDQKVPRAQEGEVLIGERYNTSEKC